MITLKKLASLWTQSDCSTRIKIQTHATIINVKLLYGLETIQLNADQLNNLDTFHLQGLIQICQITATYINRGRTNEHVYKTASARAKTQIKPTAEHMEDNKQQRTYYKQNRI